MKVRIHAFRRRIAIVALSVALGSCSEPTSFGWGIVVVERERQGFRLRNKTTEALGYAAFDRDLLALINWAMCADPTPACLRLPARGSAFVPFSEIYAMDGEVVFYVWRVVRQGDGTYEPLMVATIIATP